MTEGARIGYYILRLRAFCKCTQEELADAANISTTYLRRIEHGKANPTVNVLLNLLLHLTFRITGEKPPSGGLLLDRMLEIMPLWRYRLIRETRYDPEIGCFATLSISAETQREGNWSPVTVLHDVTLDGDAARQLVERLNRFQLSPIHLRDAVEELL